MPKEQHPAQSGQPEQSGEFQDQPEHEQPDDPELEGLVDRLQGIVRDLNASISTHNDTFEVWEKSFDIRELSEDAQQLWKMLRREMGDRELLPLHAEKFGFDLEAALDELRSRGVIDESSPTRVKIKMRRIK